MSRTYRLRHAPRSSDSPQKYVDCDIYSYRNRWQNQIWYRVAHEYLGLPCEWSDYDIESIRHDNCIPDAYFARSERNGLFQKFKHEFPYSIGPIGDSPVGARRSRKSKRWWKVFVNRSARHANQQHIITALKQHLIGAGHNTQSNIGEDIDTALCDNRHVVRDWKWK